MELNKLFRASDKLKRGEDSMDKIIKNGTIQIWQKPLSNGSWAVGIFNLGETFSVTTVDWSDLQLPENLKVFGEIITK